MTKSESNSTSSSLPSMAAAEKPAAENPAAEKAAKERAVTTVGSVKSGGKLHPPGSSITVSAREAKRLIALGAVKPVEK